MDMQYRLSDKMMIVEDNSVQKCKLRLLVQHSMAVHAKLRSLDNTVHRMNN